LKSRPLMKDKHAMILKIIGNGKTDKGVETLIRDYRCKDPRIQKIIQEFFYK